jgi:hypothetical protein
MKKIILMFSLVCFLGIAGKTQDNEVNSTNKFYVGLKIGANHSNVYDSEGEDFDADPKLGLAGGLFLSIPLVQYIGIQPELLFSQKGFKGTGRLLGTSYELTRTTSFIDVPIYLALKPVQFITFLAGPQFSYLIRQKDEFKNGTTSIAQEKEFENDNVRKNIFGFAGGLDININHLVIGARAGFDITNNHGDGTSSTPRYKNTWLQGTIGFRF